MGARSSGAAASSDARTPRLCLKRPLCRALMLEAIDKIIGVFLHGSEHARVIDSLGACPPCDLVITADFGMDMDDESAEIISFFAHLCGGKVHHLIGGEQGRRRPGPQSRSTRLSARPSSVSAPSSTSHTCAPAPSRPLLDPARKVVWVLTASQEVTNGYTQIPAEHLLISQGHLGDFNLLQSCPEVQEWFRTRDPARTLSLKGGSQGDCTGHLSGTTLRRAAALGIDTSPAAAFYLSQVATQLPINIIGTVDATDTEPAKALYEIEPFVVRIVGEHEDGRGPGSNCIACRGSDRHFSRHRVGCGDRRGREPYRCACCDPGGRHHPIQSGSRQARRRNGEAREGHGHVHQVPADCQRLPCGPAGEQRQEAVRVHHRRGEGEATRRCSRHYAGL